MRQPRADPAVGSPSSRMGRTGMSGIGREREVRIPGSAPDPGLPNRGIGVALSALLAVLLPSCLITQPVHFDEPANSPPAIASTVPPLNHVTIVTPSTGTGDAGSGTSTGHSFSAVVRDPDVTQTLNFQVTIDNSPCAACVELRGVLSPVTSATGRELRPLTIHVADALLAPKPDGSGACHFIQLFVSSGFQSGTQTPLDDADLATAVWWVGTTGTSTGIDMNGCL